MNRYHESMGHCAPPPELEEQLREAVLSAEPEPQARTAVYRPRGFFRKALLAAVLAVVLTLSVGAAVLVDWDDIFSDRFGPEGAETPMAEKAFQPVNMTSVCDDVTLTIREALVDEKSIYLILDYQLPDSVDPETVEIAYNSRENTQKDDIKLPMVTYYATDDIAWEDLKAAEQDTWATLDWTDPLTRIFYGKSESTLNRMTAAGASLLLRGEVQETEEVIAKIEAVTAADVLATARAVLDTEKISYSAVGNLKGNDFGALVEKFFK